MAKTVKKLKKKHRDRVWIDAYKCIHFRQWERGWVMLAPRPSGEGWELSSGCTGRDDEYYGPYREIARAMD